MTILKPPLGRCTFSVDLSRSAAAGRFSGRTAAAAAAAAAARLLAPPPRSLLLFQFSRDEAAGRGVGGADHSLRVAAAQSARLGGGDDHSTRLGGGELHSTRLGGGEAQSATRLGGGPAAAAMRRPAAAPAGRKLEREGLSVRKLSVASSDLKEKT